MTGEDIERENDFYRQVSGLRKLEVPLSGPLPQPTHTVVYGPIATGWVCPVCKCGVAPSVEQCPCVARLEAIGRDCFRDTKAAESKTDAPNPYGDPLTTVMGWFGHLDESDKSAMVREVRRVAFSYESFPRLMETLSNWAATAEIHSIPGEFERITTAIADADATRPLRAQETDAKYESMGMYRANPVDEAKSEPVGDSDFNAGWRKGREDGIAEGIRECKGKVDTLLYEMLYGPTKRSDLWQACQELMTRVKNLDADNLYPFSESNFAKRDKGDAEADGYPSWGPLESEDPNDYEVPGTGVRIVSAERPE
jgi:hypothetical protein